MSLGRQLRAAVEHKIIVDRGNERVTLVTTSFGLPAHGMELMAVLGVNFA